MDDRRRLSSRPPCSALRPFAETEHYTILLDAGCRLLVARRSPTPLADADDVDQCFTRLESTLAPIARPRYTLLVDTRNGPASRNDPDFERAIEQHRGRLLSGFGRVAALASTASGRLQLQRHVKEDGRAVFVTLDPAAAFEHLGLPKHNF